MQTSGVRSRNELSQSIVEPSPGETENPGNDYEYDEGADKADVCELLRQERSDVRPEELRVEEEPESIAPDDGQNVEGNIENAREYGERGREGVLVQHGAFAPCPSLNKLIRARQHRRRDSEAECLCRLLVDHQLELGRLLE